MHEELENIRSVLCKITSEAQAISEQNKILKEVNYVKKILSFLNKKKRI